MTIEQYINILLGKAEYYDNAAKAQGNISRLGLNDPKSILYCGMETAILKIALDLSVITDIDISVKLERLADIQEGFL